MVEEVKDPTLTAFIWILLWSSGEWADRTPAWPNWQRCALRRIVQNGQLSTKDLEELERICETACGITYSDGAVYKPVPLSKEHVVTGRDGNVSVSLVKLGALKGVNRIRGDPPLEFGPTPGLTIIFGDNGTGKSGYARVIKKACRARGTAQAIHPNAFDATEKGPASANITCLVGPVSTPVKWTDGGATDPRLANVFVFDSKSASSHVASDGPASFIPRGLDILPKLAKACDELKARYTKKINDEFATIARVKVTWKHRRETAVGKLVEAMTADVVEEPYKKLAMFSEEDAQKLADLNDALKSDPKVKSAKTAAAAARVRTFKEKCTAVTTGLSAAKAGAIKTANTEAKTTNAAAKAAASKKFNEKFLPGTGEEAWTNLWEIAREYAAIAYEGKEYPGENADRCVLCQQDLSPDAKDRMMRFDDYVRDESRAKADKANERLQQLSNGLDGLDALAPEFAKVKADVAGATEQVRKASQDFVTAADARLKFLKQCLKSGVWSEPPELAASVSQQLEAIAVAYDKKASMELAADDPVKKKQLTLERDELADREWLTGAIDEVLAQVGRHRLVAAFRECLKQTITNTITKRSSEIHDVLVSKAFVERFEAEIAGLGLDTLKVQLATVGGDKGERKFGVRLVNGNGAPVAEIASEGEQRCIALAAFLAELSQASHKSALVFDDPVSSLDHGRRQSVAKRLCAEASVRQVIIFTHDAVFLDEILHEAKVSEIDPHKVFICWKGNAPGHCEKGLPWAWQKYSERLAALEQHAHRLTKGWNSVPSPENVNDMRHAYSLFREALEKIVQDVVLGGVVGRYRPWIKVEMLKNVVGFNAAEFKELARLEKKASDNLAGHDPATGKQAQIPKPADLNADIAALKAVTDQIQARQPK